VNKKENLTELISLSKIDAKIANINRQKKIIPQKLENIKEKLLKKRSSYEDIIQEMNTYKERKKTLEEEIKEFSENVTKSKNKLYDIKTNDAYKMALKEIDNWEHEIKERENEILNIMEHIEENSPKVDSLIEKHKPEEEVLLKKEASLIENLKKYNDEKELLNKKRADYHVNVDKRLYSQYERIRNAKDGIALVEISDDNCKECRMRIRPQIFNQLINGELLRCPSCGRMLYYRPPEKPEEPETTEKKEKGKSKKK
jgi:uncharacterized protein